MSRRVERHKVEASGHLLLPGLAENQCSPQSQTSVAKLRNRVQLQVANLKEATAVIVKNHYLHRGRTMAQLPYWILLDGARVGVLLYAYPRMSAKFQGYGPMNLLELARMWVDPSVQGKRIIDTEGREHTFAIASCAVGKSLRRVREDWRIKYPRLPDILAVVSWADAEHHEGTIYRASNFREVGKSGGSLHGNTHRPNGGRDQLNPDYLHVKRAFIYEFKAKLRPKEGFGHETRVIERGRDSRSRRKGESANQFAQVQSRLPL